MFGEACAPSDAIYVKNANASRFSESKPEAVKCIIKNTYVDDKLASWKSLHEAQTIVRDIISINNEANFRMHKWAANDARVLKYVREEDKLPDNGKTDLGNKKERVLGLTWDRENDCLGFNLGFQKVPQKIVNGEKIPTKREFLSMAMSIYDPLGFISPFTIGAKLIMQNVWRSGVGWDKQLREEEGTKWLIWLRNLKGIDECKIPRHCMPVTDELIKTDLHIFCDASLEAFAAAAYLRSETRSRGVLVSLIMSKSRVAPVKPMTVPRLELQAALLGARMARTIVDELEIEISERVFWSDSTTVLHWIRANPLSKQMYVANRLGEIGELTQIREWRWVPTRENPADDATRWTDRPLQQNDRWFAGPNFLHYQPDTWPREKNLNETEKQEIIEMEARKEFICTVTAKALQPSFRNTLKVIR